MKHYSCIYNLDMSFIGNSLTKYRKSFEEQLSVEHIRETVWDAANTGVDAFLCSPTLLRLPIWHSEVDPHWKTTAPFRQPPSDRRDWTPSERIYYAVRDYVLSGGDPVREIYDEVRKGGMGFFFSYRMNDWHFLEIDDTDRYPTLDNFYVEHPEYRIDSTNRENPVGWDIKNCRQQNYLIPAVRHHYLALLTELTQRFDIDGLELDLMRSPNYFPLEQLEEGTVILSGFVEEVRRMLDNFGSQRNKKIPLCVRVPHRYGYCAQIGFDLQRWVKNGWVQMVNVSSSYFHTEALELEGFRAALPGAYIYAEQQMVMNNTINRFGWPSERRTPKEVLETSAHVFWCRGADGISLFNFPFTREIDQPVRDPDSVYSDPPKEILNHLTEREYLARCQKHYFTYGNHDLTADGKLPAMGSVSTVITIWDDPAAYMFAALRVICKADIRDCTKEVRLNGVQLEISDDNGELFSESTKEGQFPPEQTFNCLVPLSVLQHDNTVEIALGAKNTEIFGVELALYQ